MNLALRLELRRPDMGTLCYADIENFDKYYPMISSEGLPNWVVGAGGAVRLLIEAETVSGRKLLCQPMTSERRCKDLEIYMFNPHIKYNCLPHEIFYTCYQDKPKRCKYKGNTVPCGFFLEILCGSYFGFILPESQDIVACKTKLGNVFFCLSPEYLISSKLFNFLPYRRGHDDNDVVLLGKRFKLDINRICALARKSLWFLTYDQVKKIVTNNNFKLLDELIKKQRKILVEKINFMKELEKYSICLLRFKNTELVNLDNQKKLIELNRKRTHMYTGPSNMYLRWILSIFDFLSAGMDWSKSEQQALEKDLLKQKNNESLFKLNWEFFYQMLRIKKALLQVDLNEFYNLLLLSCYKFLLKSPFKHILLALLNTYADSLETDDYYERRDVNIYYANLLINLVGYGKRVTAMKAVI